MEDAHAINNLGNEALTTISEEELPNVISVQYTSAKNVVIYDNHIGKKEIDYFDYSNICGRAGRLMEHYIGRVINLREPPQKQEVKVDIPFVDQCPIESEVLVNLQPSEVLPIKDNIVRYEMDVLNYVL